MEAAVEQPPHLKAIFPVAGTFDLYESATHHGLVSSAFITPFLAMIGMTSERSSRFWRSGLLNAAGRILHTPQIHKKFETFNGEAAMTGLRLLLKLHHNPHPWDDLWRAIVVEHPVRDAWWDDRNLLPLLNKVKVPVYLGCDWQNVPMHLPSTFTAYAALTDSPQVRVAMLGDHGLSWPWESLHVECLAWYDHWLKGQDTGILEGPAFRYIVPGAEGWRASPGWPVREAEHRSYALSADGALATSEGENGSRVMMTLGAGLSRAQPSETDPPTFLTWTSAPLDQDLDVVGDIELQLDAAATAADTAWIATLQDVGPSGACTDVTAGYLRASLREVDESASRPGAPELRCRSFQPVPYGETVRYRIPLAPNARRFERGHSVRLFLTGDDQNPQTPAMLTYRHASVGTSCMSTVSSSSRLLLPVVPTARVAEAV
jgi:uncharacterized protein